jgi:Raf kinase inhibitor-like YbhB/YbcL family protein
MTMKLTSATFKDGEFLGNEQVLSDNYGFGCAGGNVSPQLQWEDEPDGTKSFAVTCYDPDAPTGSGFWHWVMVNIPPDVHELPLGAGNPDGSKLPNGALQLRNDTGQPGYAGPCPPEGHGPHHYIFTVFAVSQDSLPVNADASPAVAGFNLHFSTLEKATIVGLYER